MYLVTRVRSYEKSTAARPFMILLKITSLLGTAPSKFSSSNSCKT